MLNLQLAQRRQVARLAQPQPVDTLLRRHSLGYRDPRSSRYAISEENAQFNQGALLRLHWSGPYRPLLKDAIASLSASLLPCSQRSRPDRRSAHGQALTNLFLNSVAHAFPDGKGGTIDIKVLASGKDNIEILFFDDGCGMSLGVRRQAFVFGCPR